MLYVRTERRPGAKAPEALFVETRDRVVSERWLPAATMLGTYRLVLDPDATERADRVERELARVQAERDALAAAMRRAVEVVPVSVANDLRRIFREQRDAILTRGAT